VGNVQRKEDEYLSDDRVHRVADHPFCVLSFAFAS
jgi:hypothetical protein